jgi:hypothetical protein
MLLLLVVHACAATLYPRPSQPPIYNQAPWIYNGTNGSVTMCTYQVGIGNYGVGCGLTNVQPQEPPCERIGGTTNNFSCPNGTSTLQWQQSNMTFTQETTDATCQWYLRQYWATGLSSNYQYQYGPGNSASPNRPCQWSNLEKDARFSWISQTWPMEGILQGQSVVLADNRYANLECPQNNNASKVCVQSCPDQEHRFDFRGFSRSQLPTKVSVASMYRTKFNRVYMVSRCRLYHQSSR